MILLDIDLFRDLMYAHLSGAAHSTPRSVSELPKHPDHTGERGQVGGKLVGFHFWKCDFQVEHGVK